MENGSLEHLIIDNTTDGLFRVNRRAFTDPGILEVERQRVFEQCWIYAGISPGDETRTSPAQR